MTKAEFIFKWQRIAKLDDLEDMWGDAYRQGCEDGEEFGYQQALDAFLEADYESTGD